MTMISSRVPHRSLLLVVITFFIVVLLFCSAAAATSSNEVCHAKSQKLVKEFTYTVDLEIAHSHICSHDEEREVAKLINDNFDKAYDKHNALIDMDTSLCTQECRTCYKATFNEFDNKEYLTSFHLGGIDIEIQAEGDEGGYTPDGAVRVFDSRLAGLDNEEDVDLGHHPTQGNVLIIQGGNKEEPDDWYNGGTITFIFPVPVDFKSITLLDIEKFPAELDFIYASGKTDGMALRATDDGGMQVHHPNAESITQVTVRYYGSGAISNFMFCLPCVEQQQQQQKQQRQLLFRRMQQQQTTNNNDSIQRDDSKMLSHKEEDLHRRLRWAIFMYRGTGRCRFCWLDNDDERRRRATAVASSYADTVGHVYTITKDTENVETIAAQTVNGEKVDNIDDLTFELLIPALEVNEADFIQELLHKTFIHRKGHCMQGQWPYVRVIMKASESYSEPTCE